MTLPVRPKINRPSGACAGIVYAYKMAGAAAEEKGTDLDGVTRIAQKAADACGPSEWRSHPAPSHRLANRLFPSAKMKWSGHGHHGEPGVQRGPLQPADKIADECSTAFSRTCLSIRRTGFRAGQQSGRDPARGAIHL